MQTVVVHQEIPRDDLEDRTPTSSPPPIALDMTTPGTFTIAVLGVPVGIDLIIELWGGGGTGAGGSGTSAPGGCGGGGGGYLAARVPAVINTGALQVDIPIAVTAPTGASAGYTGADANLKTAGKVYARAAGGGGGQLGGGVGGGGGTITIDAALTSLAERMGTSGKISATNGVGADGGVGGGPGSGFPGAGGNAVAGGAGGLSAGGGGGGADGGGPKPGGNGSAGKGRVTWPA